jgi:hypothetical protein
MDIPSLLFPFGYVYWTKTLGVFLAKIWKSIYLQGMKRRSGCLPSIPPHKSNCSTSMTSDDALYYLTTHGYLNLPHIKKNLISYNKYYLCWLMRSWTWFFFSNILILKIGLIFSKRLAKLAKTKLEKLKKNPNFFFVKEMIFFFCWNKKHST